MSIFTSLLLVVAFAQVLLIIKAQDGLTESCLGCICEGSSHCNLTLGCSPSGFCGPFIISFSYWIDAGQPVLDNDDPQRNGAFEDCVRDLHCAANALRGYMQKFSQDCNNDGKIDCDDYVRIHGLGGFGCSDSEFENKIFYKLYARCMGVVTSASVRQLSTSVGETEEAVAVLEAAEAK